MKSSNKISAIIPAAGRATRMGNLPFSKELYPLSLGESGTTVVSEELVRAFETAGVDQLHFVIRKGKWDIPNYYGSLFNQQLPVCYHLAEVDYGVPFTVNQVYPFVKDHQVLLGFPDILFKPENAYEFLLKELNKGEAEVVLGLFPVTRPEKWDMVEIGDQNLISRIVIKPESGAYAFGWVIAAWNPEFSEFLNEFVLQKKNSQTADELRANELHFGDAIIAAMEVGFAVKGVIFEEGSCLDTGTPDEMNLAGSFIEKRG